MEKKYNEYKIFNKKIFLISIFILSLAALTFSVAFFYGIEIFYGITLILAIFACIFDRFYYSKISKNHARLLEDEIIDNITYQKLSIIKNGKEEEVRYFYNGLLSHHNDKAIQLKYKDPWQITKPYYYNGKNIEAKNLDEFKTKLKIIKNLEDFN